MEVDGVNSEKWLTNFPCADSVGIRSGARSHLMPLTASLERLMVELELEHGLMHTWLRILPLPHAAVPTFDSFVVFLNFPIFTEYK